MYHVCLVADDAEEGIGTPGLGVTDSCVAPCECWGLNLGPLPEQLPSPLFIAPFLRKYSMYFWRSHSQNFPHSLASSFNLCISWNMYFITGVIFYNVRSLWTSQAESCPISFIKESLIITQLYILSLAHHPWSLLSSTTFTTLTLIIIIATEAMCSPVPKIFTIWTFT